MAKKIYTAKDFEDFLLKDDCTAGGGTAWSSETLREYIEDDLCDEKITMDTPMEKINECLRSSGIMEINCKKPHIMTPYNKALDDLFDVLYEHEIDEISVDFNIGGEIVSKVDGYELTLASGKVWDYSDMTVENINELTRKLVNYLKELNEV